MPKIIKNGIEYMSTANKAENISMSDGRNVEAAIGDLNNNLAEYISYVDVQISNESNKDLSSYGITPTNFVSASLMNVNNCYALPYTYQNILFIRLFGFQNNTLLSGPISGTLRILYIKKVA